MDARSRLKALITEKCLLKGEFVLASGQRSTTVSNASSRGSSRLYVPHLPNARMRCSGFPRFEKSGYSGRAEKIPCRRT